MTRWTVLAWLFFAPPAAAMCNLFMAELPALKECVQAHEFTISLQEKKIQNLTREIEFLHNSQEQQKKSIDRLTDLLLTLQTKMLKIKSVQK